MLNKYATLKTKTNKAGMYIKKLTKCKWRHSCFILPKNDKMDVD